MNYKLIEPCNFCGRKNPHPGQTSGKEHKLKTRFKVVSR